MFLKELFKSNLQRNIEIYEMYLQSKITKSLDTADTTYATYKSNMKLFLTWFHEQDKGYYLLSKKMINEFPEILDRYMIYCLTIRKNNKVTVNNKIVTLSSFYIWARRTRRILSNPVLDIERQKKSRQDKRRNNYFLTVNQIKTIKKVMEEEPKKYDIKTRLIFYIFIDSAIRIGELMRLKISNLDLNNAVFNNIRQKGGEVRDVIIYDETVKLLKEYLKWREENNITLDPLFVTKYRGGYKQMSRETIRAKIKKIGHIIGIKDLYPHTLRKTVVNIITRLGSVEDGALIANHKCTTVTKEHYVQELTAIEKNEKILKLRALAQF